MTAKKLSGWVIIALMVIGFGFIVVDMVMETWWMIFVPIGAGVIVIGLIALAHYLITSPNKKQQP